jgi:hypothetical protein
MTTAHVPAGTDTIIIDAPPPPPPPPVIVAPFPGFAAANAAVPAGGTVKVPAGTYKLPAKALLTTQGVTWDCTGSTFDASGLAVPVQQAAIVASNDVTFHGGRITGSSGAAFQGEGDRVTLDGTEIDHCIEEGYIWHGADGRILSAHLHHLNETGAMWDSSEQGAGKAAGSRAVRLLIDGCHIHDIGLGGKSPDAGQGAWWDIRADAGEMRNCLVERVFYAGAMFEISSGFRFHHNVVHHCGTTPSGSGFWGAGFLGSGCSGADVYSNVFAYNQSGVRIIVQNRGDLPPGYGRSNTLHDNDFIDNPHAAFAFDTDYAAFRPTFFAPASGNAAYANRFHGPLAVQWNGTTAKTLAAIDAIPGGGGNRMLSDAEAAAKLAPYGIVA